MFHNLLVFFHKREGILFEIIGKEKIEVNDFDKTD